MFKIKRKVSLFLLIMLLITSLPIQNVFAGNNDTLPSNPSAGQGSSDWKYAEDWEGVRISLYWAPSEKDFINGTELVRQLGETKDFTKTGPRYKVDEYTTYSIYRYMNGDSKGLGEPYKPTSNILRPYYYIGKEDSSIIANMPAVWNGKKVDWDNWIEGNDYKNVPEIARLLGTKVSSEDFIRGNLDVEGYKAKGLYKIFIEPIIYPTVAGKGMVLTLRDAIRWEEAFNRGEIKPEQMKGSSGNLYTPSLTMNLLPIFEYVANSQFLIEDEPSISMTANSSNYRVDGSTGSSARREEIKNQIKPGGKIYSSMGVGVFNSPNIQSNDKDYVVETYVKVVGINPDGTLKLEKIKETELKEAEFYENGALKIEEVKELEEGTAYLDAIITSPKDLTKDIEKVDWTGDLPKTNAEKIEPTAEDIWRLFPSKISALKHILDVMEISETIEIGDTTLTDIKELEELKKDLDEGKQVEVARIQKAMIKVNNLYDSYVIDLSKASPEFIKIYVDYMLTEEINKYNMTHSNMTSSESLLKSVVIIPSINEVYLDTEHPGESIQVDLEITTPKSNGSEELIELNNFKAGNETGEKTVAYVRYLVIPTRKEIIFEEIYKNGTLIDRTRTVKDLPIVEVEDGVYEEETYLTDLRLLGKELVSWGTSKGTPLLNSMPTNPIKSGTTYEPIIGLETDENVYVTWKTETFTGTATSNYLVDEWRLSKYTDNIGFNSQAYMGLSLRADQGHRTSTLSPSGRYNYDTINPNSKVTDKNYNPENMKYNAYLHSKAITQGSYSISHNRPSVLVDITGNLNLIKSTELAGLRIASWTADTSTKSGLNLHNLEVSNKGVNYSGNTVITKSDILKYGIKNKDTYTHMYGVRYHYTCYHEDYSHDVCACYTLPETPAPTYNTADYKVDSTFERYKVVNTDSRLFKLANVETKVENGKTTVSEQSPTVLSVYPEIPMLFDNDKGDSSVKFAVGDMVRKVQPITFHALEYKVYIDKATTTGMSVATDSRAKATANKIGLGNVPVINKGSGLTTNFEVKDSKGSTKQGILEVRTYAIDIQNDLKTAWGNTSYNTSTINDNFLSKFGSKQSGKWVFNAKATEKLFVASSPNFTGPEVVQNPKFNEKSKNEKEYKLTVRGGVVTHVNGTSIATIQTSNPNLYEALVGMKLVGVSKEQSVLSTFEHQTGKALTEQKFKDLAKSVRGIDSLELGKGWYSEDSTVLVIKEYITELTVPNTAFTDKIPMTVPGLQTPVNKQQFFSTIAKGHNIVKYEVGSNIKAYFEHNTSKESNFGKAITGYGVPNVSITDSMFGN